jgi:hypothetical protein
MATISNAIINNNEYVRIVSVLILSDVDAAPASCANKVATLINNKPIIIVAIFPLLPVFFSLSNTILYNAIEDLIKNDRINITIKSETASIVRITFISRFQPEALPEEAVAVVSVCWAKTIFAITDKNNRPKILR